MYLQSGPDSNKQVNTSQITGNNQPARQTVTTNGLVHQAQAVHHDPQLLQNLPFLPQREQSALDTLAEVSRQYGNQQVSGATRQDHDAMDAQRAMVEQTLYAELQKAGISSYTTAEEVPGLYSYTVGHDAQQHQQQQHNGFDASLVNADAFGSSPLVQAATAANQQLERVHADPTVNDPSMLDPQLDDIGPQYDGAMDQATVQQPNGFHTTTQDMTNYSWNPTSMSGRHMTFGSLTAPSNEPTPGFGLLQKASKSKTRGRFTDMRRKEVQEIRKRGACIRCRMLKKPCSEGTPCNTCKTVETARLWKGTCIRSRIAEEFTLWSTNLFHSKAALEVSGAVQGLGSVIVPGRIEVGLEPSANARLVFQARQYGDHTKTNTIDPNLQDVESALDGFDKMLLLEEGDSMPDKISAYCNSEHALNALVDAEPNIFLKLTLSEARSLLSAEQMTANQSTNAARSCYNLPHLLINNVIELWAETTFLTRSAKYALILAYNPLATSSQGIEVGSWPEGAKVSLPTQLIPPESPTHHIIRGQLLAATESRCSRLSKSVMNELERRLLQRQQVSGHATLVAAVILLNCIERMTALYRSFDPSEHCTHPSPADWPLDTPPSALWPHGEHFAKLLIMLLRMRALPPPIYRTSVGTLKVLQESALPVKLNGLPVREQVSEQTKMAAAWLDPMELDADALIAKLEGAVVSDVENCDLRFIAKLLLPEKLQPSALTG